MENIKQEVISLLKKNIPTLDSTNLDKTANDICGLIQVIFDPENQPNQLVINNPFTSGLKYKNDTDITPFEFVCNPVVKYLRDNYHLHTSIHITSTSVTLKEDIAGYGIPLEG